MKHNILKFPFWTVLRAKITEGPILEQVPNPHGFGPNSMEVYKLHILVIYRGYEQVQKSHSWNSDGGTIKLYSPSKMHSCNLDFMKKGKEYLIGGNIRHKRLHASLCNLVREWQGMTFEEEMNLYYHYLPNCNCRVETCFGEKKAGQACEATEKMACGYNFNEPRPASLCRRKYQYCKISRQRNSCAWHETEEYKQCMANIPWGNTIVIVYCADKWFLRHKNDTRQCYH